MINNIQQYKLIINKIIDLLNNIQLFKKKAKK